MQIHHPKDLRDADGAVRRTARLVRRLAVEHL
jgi:hypothetical protein